jgi:hypothetical protein
MPLQVKMATLSEWWMMITRLGQRYAARQTTWKQDADANNVRKRARKNEIFNFCFWAPLSLVCFVKNNTDCL